MFLSACNCGCHNVIKLTFKYPDFGTCAYQSSFSVIIIIINIIISFMQGIYTYIPEANYVPRVYSVAAILLLLFMMLISLVSVLNLLYFYISTFRSMCAVPNMAIFCSFLTSCFPGMLLTYFLSDFEIVPAAPIITGIAFGFTFHMCCMSTVRYLYFRIFSASFLIAFPSPEIATSINIYVPFSLSRIIMSGLLLGIVLSVCTCWFHNKVTLPPWLVSTDFGTCSYQCFLSNCTPVSLHTLKCSCAHTIMSFYVVFFCQYWECWYYVVYCLVKLLAKSALLSHIIIIIITYCNFVYIQFICWELRFCGLLRSEYR